MFSFFRNKFLFITDYDVNIGNFSEKLLHALYKAKRENKQVVFVRKRLFFKFLFDKLRYKQLTGLYRLESKYIYKNKFLDMTLGILFGFIFSSQVAYKSILYILRINRPFSYDYLGVGCKDLMNTENEKVFNKNPSKNIDWSTLFEEKLDIDLSKKDIDLSKQNLLSLGVKDDDWFVCLHIRTTYFGNESEKATFRNSTPENYIKAIKYINDLGGKVIRLGDPIDMSIKNICIDYPNSIYKSELMDLFLIKNCRFYIGTNSGILDTAFLFGTPVLGVNYSDFGLAKAYKSYDKILFIKVKNKSIGQILTLEKVFSNKMYINTNINDIYLNSFFEKYQLVENSEEDIFIAVEEMIENLVNPKQKDDLDIKFDELVYNTISRWIDEEKDFFSKNWTQTELAYRYSNRTKANGRTCKFQLIRGY